MASKFRATASKQRNLCKFIVRSGKFRAMIGNILCMIDCFWTYILVKLLAERKSTMRQRLLFCLLFIGILLYYAIPQLRFYGSIEEVIFSISWLVFALLAAGGNIADVLYPKKKLLVGNRKKNTQKQKRMYNY